ncbi:MAG: hypothetical protein ABIR54_10940 [Burkholderiaceae bacterium]|jgi:hypothetical protein
MSKTQLAFAVSLPLALTLQCWLTMCTLISAGTESMRLYGFPLGWYAPSQAASMAYDVALGPFVVDFAVYLAIALAVAALSGIGRASAPGRKLVGAILWTAAVASIAWNIAPLLMDPHVVAWTLDGYFDANAVRTHTFQIGPARWGSS